MFFISHTDYFRKIILSYATLLTEFSNGFQSSPINCIKSCKHQRSCLSIAFDKDKELCYLSNRKLFDEVPSNDTMNFITLSYKPFY